MDPAHTIELDNDTESDCLTTLESGETPTLDDSESPTIKALAAAQAATNDATFNLVVARMPSDHRVKIGRAGRDRAIGQCLMRLALEVGNSFNFSYLGLAEFL